MAQEPVPAASPRSREAARGAFLHGSREATGPATAPVTELPTARAGGRRWLPLAVAAAVATIVFASTRPAGDWAVVALGESGAASIDGAPAALGREFAEGRVAAGAHSDIHVELDRRLRLRVLPGGRVVLPPPPGRWAFGDRVLTVEAGEVLASSGERSLGFDLVVETEEARVRIVGTTFAVRRNDDGTCICLWEGDVAVEPADGSAAVRIDPGHRIQIYTDRRAPLVEPLNESERAALGELHTESVLLTAAAR